MKLEEFKSLIFDLFINDAKSTLYQVEKRSKIDSRPANSWGGDFASLPDCVSFYQIQDYIEEYEKNKLKKI